MTNTIQTAMMIDRAALDYFGCSKGPVAIFDTATLACLAKSDGPATRRADGRTYLAIGGVEFVARVWRPESAYLLLDCSDARAMESAS